MGIRYLAVIVFLAGAWLKGCRCRKLVQQAIVNVLKPLRMICTVSVVRHGMRAGRLHEKLLVTLLAVNVCKKHSGPADWLDVSFTN